MIPNDPKPLQAFRRLMALLRNAVLVVDGVGQRVGMTHDDRVLHEQWARQIEDALTQAAQPAPQDGDTMQTEGVGAGDGT